MTYNSGGMGRVELISQSDKTQVDELERNRAASGGSLMSIGRVTPPTSMDSPFPWSHWTTISCPFSCRLARELLTVTYRPAGSNAAIAALGLGLGYCWLPR